MSEGNEDKVLEALSAFWHTEFREGQRAPIEAVLRGEDAAVDGRDRRGALRGPRPACP